MSTPIEVPSYWPIQGMQFRLNHFQTSGSSYGGAGQTGIYADPIWTAQFVTPPLQEANRGQLEATLEKLEGMANPVLLYDVRRPVPLSVEGTLGSPWGSPVLVSDDRANQTLGLGGLTANFAWTAGDYLAFQDTNSRWHLHKVTDDATADGTGAVTLNVTPRPARNLAYALNAPVRVRNACCTMVIQWDPQELERVGQGLPVNFQAHQVTRAFI